MILSESEESGVYIVVAKNGRFCNRAFEYDPGTLKDEYVRDVNKGMDMTFQELFPG